MPEGVVYVGRPTKWGNPFGFIESEPGHREESVETYREWLLSGIRDEPSRTGYFAGALDAVAGYPGRTAAVEGLAELCGKDLACWCPLDKACHADVLLELANPKEGAETAV